MKPAPGAVIVPDSSKRWCHKCHCRRPLAQMKKKRTPSGGVIYTCLGCEAPAKAVRR